MMVTRHRRRTGRLVTLSILILLSSLALPSHALPSLGPPATSLPGAPETWVVSVHWYPHIQGTFDMEVSMTSPWRGQMRSWAGREGYRHCGDIVTDGTRVFWHLPGIGFYLGRHSGPDAMSGRVLGPRGHLGLWRAVRVASPAEEDRSGFTVVGEGASGAG